MQINRRVFKSKSICARHICLCGLFVFALVSFSPRAYAQPLKPGIGADDIRINVGNRARAGQAEYTGEFYRVGGRKIHLLRSLGKVAIRHLPGERLSIMNGIEAVGWPEGEFLLHHEILKRGITVLQTSRLHTLDELTQSIHQLEQVPGVVRAVPVYIHEESGLELIATEEFIVKLSTGASLAELEAINQATGAVIARTLSGTADQFILSLAGCTPEELLSICELYWQDPAIEWAEPDFLAQAVKSEIRPNDPYYDNYLWHLPDIDAPRAWDITTGSDQICIAIIDDGMKLTHEDLAANLFTNSGEIQGNGIDDDDNGYTDDYNGWNFYEQNNNPNPAYKSESHGTSVAGIAAAVGNNNIGVTGCAFNCKLMPLKIYKVYNETEYYVYSGISEAILYAAGFARNGTDRWRGADIINISSGFSCANCLDDAIAQATTDGRNGKGCAIFCASGNDADGWSPDSVEVSSGYHTIRWEYVKDSSESRYADTVWIDNVTFPDGTTETFESGNLSSVWSTGGNANWIRVQDGDDGNHAMTGWDGPGSHSMRAGTIGHGKSTYLQVSKNFQEGNIDFNWWISTELTQDETGQQKFDKLHITVDGQPYMVQGQNGPVNRINAGYSPVSTPVHYPASHPDTIAVGASTNFGYRSDYSCYGYGLDFVAPSDGGSKNTVTTGYNPGPEDKYVYFSGTSSSSPLAAGVGALMLSRNPDLTAYEVRQIMRESCEQIGNVTYDENGRNEHYGYGRINANLAVNAAGSSTNVIFFADPNLKVAVETALGVSDPTPSDMLGLTSLRAPSAGIKELTGLEYATNLTSLTLYGNDIVNISPLSELTNLTRLTLWDNDIVDISPLSGLTNLTSLSLWINDIVDISPVARLTNLTSLDLGSNNIVNISPVAGLANLTSLNLYNNDIVDITPLANLTNLKNLDLNVNHIPDLSPLTNMVRLTKLDVRSNPLSWTAINVQIPQIIANNPGIDLRQ